MFPGIALAREFQRQLQKIEVLFVGTSRGLEDRVLERERLPLRVIRAEGLIGRGLVGVLRSLVLLPVGFRDAYRVLRDFKPHLVIGIGGYASGPVMVLAGFWGSCRVILEPNAFPGWTNRLLARLVRVDLVVLAFEEGRDFFKRAKRVLVLGNPVRRELISEQAPSAPSNRTLLVLGGSQGAHSLNRAMIQALDDFRRLKPDLFIIHQTGERDFERVKLAYEEKGIKARVEPFLFDMDRVYREADLILSRAGATTLAEITACGKPAILVPYPYATHQHQLKNALALASAGAAVLIEDHQLNGQVIVEKVMGLFGDPERLRAMSEQSRSRGNPRATEDIVRHCIELMNG